MNKYQVTNNLKEDLKSIINRYLDENDLGFVEIMGILEMLKNDIYNLSTLPKDKKMNEEQGEYN